MSSSSSRARFLLDGVFVPLFAADMLGRRGELDDLLAFPVAQSMEHHIPHLVYSGVSVSRGSIKYWKWWSKWCGREVGGKSINA